MIVDNPWWYTTAHPSMAKIRIFLVISINEESLIKEFSYYYYGVAYKDILNYFKILEESVVKTNSKLLVKTSVNSKYLDSDFILKAKTILDSALKKVPKSSIYFEHINELYISIDYVQLLKGTISNEDKTRFKNF